MGLTQRVKDFIAVVLGSEAYEVIPLAGDASARQYFRIVYNEQSLVLMLWEPFIDDGKYPFLSVHSLLNKHGVGVPRVVAKEPKLGVVILEDLGDLTLERKFWEHQDQEKIVPFYKQAIDELIKIHYPASFDEGSDCVAFHISFDKAKLLWEMNYGREHLIEKLCKVQLLPQEREEIERVFVEICTELDAQEKFICHRDYHSRNLMLKLGKMRVIDFQDARLGPIQYDLVSLIHDSYVQLNEETSRVILDYYLSEAKKYRNGQIDREEFFRVFRLQMLQRCFKACGSFASFFNMRKDTRYLKYIQPTINKVAVTLMQYPEYQQFYDILHKKGVLTRSYSEDTCVQ